MSRTTTATILLTPRVPLRLRLAAFADLSKRLDVDSAALALTCESLPLARDLQLRTAAPLATGNVSTLLAELPSTLVDLANPTPTIDDRHRLERTVELLTKADHLVLCNAVADTMVELGLHTTAASDVIATALHGQAGPQHVLAVIVNGTLELDVLGCEGTTCEPIVERLFEGLARRGISVDELDARAHADPEGGHLIAVAAAAAFATDASLEEGAIAARGVTEQGARRKRSRAGAAVSRAEVRNG